MNLLRLRLCTLGHGLAHKVPGCPDTRQGRRDDRRGRTGRDRGPSPCPFGRSGPGAAGAARPDPRCGRGQPQPGGGQRGPARHRQGLRRVADGAQPGRRRLLPRPGLVGALPRGRRRPLRPQAHAHPGRGAVGASLPDRRVGAFGRGARARPAARRRVGGDGVPDDAGTDHRPVVRTGAHEVDRPVVGARRGHRGARPAALGHPPGALLVGIGLPDHPAPGRRGAWSSPYCSYPAT